MQLIPKKSDAMDVLVGLLKSRKSSRDHALAMLWTLTRIDHPEARVEVRHALSHPEEDVRQAAMHSISLWRDQAALGDHRFQRALDAGKPHVRRVAAETIGRLGTAEDVAALLKQIPSTRGPSGVDRFLEHALIYAAGQINDAVPLRTHPYQDRPVTHRAALLALDNVEKNGLQPADVEPHLLAENAVLNDAAWWLVERHPEWQELAVTALRPQLDSPPETPQAMATLCKRLVMFRSSVELQTLLARSLAKPRSEQIQLMLLGAMRDFRLQQLPKSWLAPLTQGLEGPPSVARASLSVLNQASRTKLDAAIIRQLTRLSADEEQPKEVRLRAYLLTPPPSRLRDDTMLRFVCEQFELEADITLRTLAVDALKTTPSNSKLLTLVAEHLPRAGAMELPTLVQLFKSSTDSHVGAALVAALERSPAATALFPDKLEPIFRAFGDEVVSASRPLLAKIETENQSKIERVEAVLKLMPTADTRRGLAVFQSARASCIACHRRGYIGGDIGPDLNRIGQIRNERDLLESILFPSLSFVRSFEPATIVTDDGRIHNGMVRRETGKSVTLQIDAKRSIEIPTSSIEARRMGTVSIMPAGLEKQLTPQELADLVKYLREQ